MKSEIVTTRSYREGDVIFQQGEPCDTAYLVREGLIQVARKEPSGSLQVVGYAGPGQIFGEDALLAEGNRGTIAVAKKSSKCVAIDRQKLKQTLKSQDPFIVALFNILATNMQSMIAKGADLDCLLQDLAEEDDGVVSLQQALDNKTRAEAQSKPAKAPALDELEDDDAFLI